VTTTHLLDANAVAERLGISVDYAYRLLGSGDIAATRIGRKVRCTEEALAAYIDANTAAPRRSRKGAAA
jgi:excisionase family DNA binding protein